MSSALLTTKLYIPPFRADLVARPHLVERFKAGLGQDGPFARRLTLVSAPAGFGKTTLLSEWGQPVSDSPWPGSPSTRETTSRTAFCCT